MEPPKIPLKIPLLVVVSGPSGVGKSSLCERLFAEDYSLEQAVSATTRAPRSGEVDGRHYHFLSKDDFKKGIADQAFLEWAEVHSNLYGTLKSEVDERMAQDKTPVLNIDVQGGESIKKLIPDAVLIFLMPPSWQALEDRLKGRGTDAAEILKARMAAARREIAAWTDYDYVVVNDALEAAVSQVRQILAAERARVNRISKHSN